jgi:hypothetical protein
MHHSEKTYYLPSKEWECLENEIWTDYKGVENQITTCKEKASAIVLAKYEGTYLSFFIVLVVAWFN